MTRRALAAQAAFWAGYGVLHYLGRLPAITNDEWPAIALASAVLALTGLTVSCAVAASISLAARRTRHELAIGIVAALAGAWIWMFVDRALLVSIAAAARVSIPWDRFPRGVDLEYLFVMLAWAAGLLALRARERQRALAEQVLVEQVAARDARLAAIGARLQPHFLFNALNTARSLAAEDPAKTRELLSRISNFLRHALDTDADVPVTVRDEFAAARAYLGIETARFEDDLAIEMQLDPDAEDVLLPPFVLQPLVENAVRHADADADGRRRVRVHGTASTGMLTIAITNVGSIAGPPRDGSGLSIARARLEQMYGAHQRIDVHERDGIVTATLTVDAPARAEAS